MEGKTFTLVFGAKKMIWQELISLVVSFIVLCLLLGSYYFLKLEIWMFLAVFGFWLLPFWVLGLIRFITSFKKPLHRITIDLSGVKINDDFFEFKEIRNLVFTEDSWLFKYFPFFSRRLYVKSKDGKILHMYNSGPSWSPNYFRLRKSMMARLNEYYSAISSLVSDHIMKKMRKQTYGRTIIKFPINSIIKSFYVKGIMMLGFPTLGYAFSFFPVGDDKGLNIAMLKVLRPLSIVALICGVIMTVVFFKRVFSMPRVIVVDGTSININGREFEKDYIVSIRMHSKNLPSYNGDEDSMLLINYKGKTYSYFLGQANNKDCFEPRRLLISAINNLMKSDDD